MEHTGFVGFDGGGFSNYKDLLQLMLVMVHFLCKSTLSENTDTRTETELFSSFSPSCEISFYPLGCGILQTRLNLACLLGPNSGSAPKMKQCTWLSWLKCGSHSDIFLVLLPHYLACNVFVVRKLVLFQLDQHQQLQPAGTP